MGMDPVARELSTERRKDHMAEEAQSIKTKNQPTDRNKKTKGKIEP